jgi:hypothetical protein
MATPWHGAALITQGRYEEGIAGLRRGISTWRATGGPISLACRQSLSLSLWQARREAQHATRTCPNLTRLRASTVRPRPSVTMEREGQVSSG